MSGMSGLPDAVEASNAVRAAMEAEFATWRNALPVIMISTGGPVQRSRACPDPAHPGALPHGWTSKAVLTEFTEDTDLHLLHRSGGGVGLLSRNRRLQSNRLLQTSDTLVGLDAYFHERHPSEGDADQPAMGTARTWVRTVLVSLYDTTDPVEAAEQTLLALSGRLRTPPRAAY